VPEYQCAIKRESKRAQKEKDKPNSTTKGDNIGPSSLTSIGIVGSALSCLSASSSPDKDEKPCIRSIHASMNGSTNGQIHSSSSSSSTTNNHHNHHHHLNNNHSNHHNNNNHNNIHNNSINSSSHHIDNSTTSLSMTTTSSTTNNLMNHSNHSNGLTHTITINNNTIRSLNNNNKILTSNDRILNHGVKPLTQAQHETINKLVTFQEEFESPPEDDVKKITVSTCRAFSLYSGLSARVRGFPFVKAPADDPFPVRQQTDSRLSDFTIGFFSLSFLRFSTSFASSPRERERESVVTVAQCLIPRNVRKL